MELMKFMRALSIHKSENLKERALKENNCKKQINVGKLSNDRKYIR